MYFVADKLQNTMKEIRIFKTGIDGFYQLYKATLLHEDIPFQWSPGIQLGRQHKQ